MENKEKNIFCLIKRKMNKRKTIKLFNYLLIKKEQKKHTEHEQITKE